MKCFPSIPYFFKPLKNVFVSKMIVLLLLCDKCHYLDSPRKSNSGRASASLLYDIEISRSGLDTDVASQLPERSVIAAAVDTT